MSFRLTLVNLDVLYLFDCGANPDSRTSRHCFNNPVDGPCLMCRVASHDATLYDDQDRETRALHDRIEELKRQFELS